MENGVWNVSDTDYPVRKGIFVGAEALRLGCEARVGVALNRKAPWSREGNQRV